MGQRRRFTPEFKRQAVQFLTAGQRPAAEIARELGIPRNRLYTWQKAVAVHGEAFLGSGRQVEPAAELARLRRELARVTEERGILKKPPRTLRGSPHEVRVHSDSHPPHRVIRLCVALGVSRSGYYAWQDRPRSARIPENQRLVRLLRQLHQEMREELGGDQTLAQGSAPRHSVWATSGRSAAQARTARDQTRTALPGHRRASSAAATSPQSAPPAVCCGHAESCLSGRCHDGLHASRLALCGSAAQSLFTAGHRLGHAGQAGSAADARRARHGGPPAPHPSGLDSSLRPGSPMQLCRLSTATHHARHDAEYESEGQLL